MSFQLHPQSFWVEWLSPGLGSDPWCGSIDAGIALLNFCFYPKGPGHSSDEGCSVGVLFIHGFGEDGPQNQTRPTVLTPSNKDMQTGAMC